MRRTAIAAILGAALIAALPSCRAAPASSEAEASAEGADHPGPVKTAVSAKHSGFADSGGVRIAYDVYGDLGTRTPLLVLHGSLMSGAAMMPLVEPFISSRPVITVDARGHGRTGDVPGPITYQMMADDAAAVLRSLKVGKADVLGYSMGGTTAIQLTVRHPDLVGKQVIVSAPAWRKGWYPSVQASFEQWTPQMFAGTPVERSYKALSATPDRFPDVIVKLRALENSSYDVSEAALRAIAGKTMIIVGDSDGLDLQHALALFHARGGPDPGVSTRGYISAAPRARLAVLPAMSHVGMANEGDLIGRLVTPFLDDQAPPRPSGFFKGMDEAPAAPAKGQKRN